MQGNTADRVNRTGRDGGELGCPMKLELIQLSVTKERISGIVVGDDWPGPREGTLVLGLDATARRVSCRHGRDLEHFLVTEQFHLMQFHISPSRDSLPLPKPLTTRSTFLLCFIFTV